MPILPLISEKQQQSEKQQKKKEFSLTYQELVGVVEEKRERKKVQHFRSLFATVYTKLAFFFLCESSKKSIKGQFFFKYKKKRQFIEK